MNLSTSGTLTGKVTDSLDQPVNGAIVLAYDSGTLYTSTITDETGGYSILGLTQGSYDIIAQYMDYTSVQIDDIEIKAGVSITQDIKFNNQ